MVAPGIFQWLGLSLPMRGLKYGWRNTEKHPKRALHHKMGGEAARSIERALAP